MKRSKHSLSNYKIFSCDMGQLIPINLEEVIPGDTFQAHSSVLLRVSPLVAPVMHPVHVRIHHWFVPWRIVWDGWEDFITGEDDTPPPSQEILGSLFYKNSLYDYFGYPIPEGAWGGGNNLTVSSLPNRAYSKIYNEFYRDQDLVAEISDTAFNPQQVAWGRDYFTTARPWPQKGGDITVPVKGVSPVRSVTSFGGSTLKTLTLNDAMRGQGSSSAFNTPTDGVFSLSALNEAATSTAHVTIEDLREANALQRYAEARSRYGSRYTEYLRYLGVNPPDSRLQRPEYLGGGKQTISFSEVLQTSNDGTNGNVGDLAGHGIAALKTRRYRKFFSEHGCVMTLMSVLPISVYQQGISRKWTRTTKEDYYQRELEQIGQQEVLNKEIYVDGTGADEDVFGYQDRYDEYRHSQNTVAGDFRDTLDYWHMSRKFASRPALNATFVKSVPTKRIHAVQTEDVLWCMAQNTVRARRMIRKTATPRLF